MKSTVLLLLLIIPNSNPPERLPASGVVTSVEHMPMLREGNTVLSADTDAGQAAVRPIYFIDIL